MVVAMFLVAAAAGAIFATSSPSLPTVLGAPSSSPPPPPSRAASAAFFVSQRQLHRRRQLRRVSERWGGGFADGARFRRPASRTLSSIQAASSSSDGQSSKIDTGTGATASTKSPHWDRDTLYQYAERQGVKLSLTTLGPGYRGVARSTTNSSDIFGYVEGFIRPVPSNYLHVDKMEVFQKVVDKVRKDDDSPLFTGGGGTPLGVGLLVGYDCLLHGLENNCGIAEFLAIDDEEYQHKRLVRLYKLAGFKFVKYVGDDFGDIPDRLIWGGCGSLLRVDDIENLLVFWTRLFEKNQKRQLEQKPP